jgi:hypothetical protein
MNRQILILKGRFGEIYDDNIFIWIRINKWVNINFSSKLQQVDNVVSYPQSSEMVGSTRLSTKNASSINNNNKSK